MVATSCHLNAPGAPPRPSRYVCTGPREVSSLATDPPGTPMTPCMKIYNIHIIDMMNPQYFTSVQTFHTHNSLSHTTLSHTSLSHTHKSLTHNSLSHTSLSHTHNSLTHNSLTHTTLSHTQLSHTHTTFSHATLTHDLRFVWQVWHFWHRAGSGGRLVVAVVAAAVCVASVVLGGIGLHFAWQAWHLATSACALCGKRGTYGNGLALVVPVCRRGRRGYWCGRRGLVTSTFALGGSRHRPALCVARLSPWTPRLFVWQAWRLAPSHTHTHTRSPFTHHSFTDTSVASFIHLPHAKHLSYATFTCSFPPSFQPVAFRFPAFPISFSHLLGDYWKKLTCRVIRSFNFRIFELFPAAKLIRLTPRLFKTLFSQETALDEVGGIHFRWVHGCAFQLDNQGQKPINFPKAATSGG